mgnify:FL=1
MNNILRGVTKRFEPEKFDKYSLVSLIDEYMSWGRFTEMLEWFSKKSFKNHEFYGILYSDAYEKDDEEYFGDNNILVYYGNDDWKNTDNIVSYSELYDYLKVACEYYIENIPEDKEEVEALLAGIKVTYNIK